METKTHAALPSVITHFDEVLFAVVFQGNLHTCAVQRDETMIAQLLGKAHEFLAELDQARATGIDTIYGLVTPEIQQLILLKGLANKINDQLSEIESQVKELAEKILDQHKATKIENQAITIARVEREGSVDYKRIPELSGVDLNAYRKRGSSYLKITIKGAGNE